MRQFLVKIGRCEVLDYAGDEALSLVDAAQREASVIRKPAENRCKGAICWGLHALMTAINSRDTKSTAPGRPPLT
jgi:hypothetical protein